MPGYVREVKQVTATIASGQATSSGIFFQGYALAGLQIPVLTSASVSFLISHTGGTFQPVYDRFGAIVSAATPGGTGGVALSSDDLSPLAAYHAEVRLSANANQGSARSFVWHLKG